MKKVRRKVTTFTEYLQKRGREQKMEEEKKQVKPGRIYSDDFKCVD